MGDRFTVRLDDLAEPLKKRAALENNSRGKNFVRVTPSSILQKSLRAYLNGDYIQIIEAQAIIESLDKLRNDLARVGGNLNQLAHVFNMEDRVDEGELRKNHDALRTEFRQVIGVLRDIEQELYKRR